MRKFISLAISFIFLALTGCQVINDNIRQSVSENELAVFKQLELLLLDYNFKKNKEILNEVTQKLDNLNKKAALNKRYQAKVYGLQGEVDYYRGNMEAVKKYLDIISYMYNNEERYFILSALLTDGVDKKLSILQNGLTKADSTGLIKLSLARLYFQKGDYRLATVHFDDAFQALDEKYKTYYLKERELAFQFIANPPGNTKNNLKLSEVVALEQLSVKHVIMLLAGETDFFAYLAPKKTVSDTELLAALKQADYIYDKTLQLDSICPRKDLAYLLLKILVYLENDTSLLTGYTKQFQGQTINIYTPVSPVPDVRIGIYYFDAVLVMVEREIMELPDGIHFFPESSVSGIQLSRIIQQLKML